MPRGKRTVYAMICSSAECRRRVGTVRLHKQNNKGKSPKDFSVEKYCSECRKQTKMKLKEEKHSN
ncbi:hypothetical protein A3D11_02710 [Candidatus Peribacteria bacterium RIFCSPHIGHO2_02_FULL_49_16]|nr:MAG: hypothetical protein A2880_01850 [Candidatus Peribacteria bacterium RIFCSPHIGHO2_01_FULL_49_38]OGJ58505.1 MAG: hypothetical protein A3D11_02710 [Candidatus Peribacteria bacterium RIFCSPHIGHO2_02_FULL_49_16]